MGSHGRGANALESARRVDEAGDGFVVEAGKLCKNKILVAEPREFVSQQAGRLRSQSLLGRPPAIYFAQGQVNLQRRPFLYIARKTKHSFHQLLSIVPLLGSRGPFPASPRSGGSANDF